MRVRLAFALRVAFYNGAYVCSPAPSLRIFRR